MGTFIDRYWYVLLGLILGVFAAVFIFGPSLAARAAAKPSRSSPFSRSSLAALGLGLVAGALALPLLDAETLMFLLIALAFGSVLLGWVLMFENNAVRFNSWFRFFGPFELDPERMASPIRHSWALTAMFLLIGLLAGACVRLLTLASA